MTAGDWVLFGAVALVGANQLAGRMARNRKYRVPFWALQALNFAAALWLMLAGIPGLQGAVRVLNWVLALLVVFRFVQNNNALLDAARQRAREADQSQKELEEKFRAALRAGEE